MGRGHENLMYGLMLEKYRERFKKLVPTIESTTWELLALANLMLALAANRRYAYQIDWRIMPLR
jgi:hypothetical protein